MLIETFDISFDNTQNKQQYGTQITYIKLRKQMVVRNMIKKNLDFSGSWYFGGPHNHSYLVIIYEVINLNKLA